jgi:IS5 family transposase
VDSRAVPSDTTATAEESHRLTESLFGLLQQHLGGRRLQSNEEVEMAVREWLRIHKPDLYGSRMLQRGHVWKNASIYSGLVLKNNDS